MAIYHSLSHIEYSCILPHTFYHFINLIQFITLRRYSLGVKMSLLSLMCKGLLIGFIAIQFCRSYPTKDDIHNGHSNRIRIALSVSKGLDEIVERFKGDETIHSLIQNFFELLHFHEITPHENALTL